MDTLGAKPLLGLVRVNPLGILTLSGMSLGLQRQELHASDIAMERA